MNVDIKKEAEYFGDIIMVPYMDHYDLVVLKTIAICEYGVSDRRGKLLLFVYIYTFQNFTHPLILQYCWLLLTHFVADSSSCC